MRILARGCFTHACTHALQCVGGRACFRAGAGFGVMLGEVFRVRTPGLFFISIYPSIPMWGAFNLSGFGFAYVFNVASNSEELEAPPNGICKYTYASIHERMCIYIYIYIW